MTRSPAVVLLAVAALVLAGCSVKPAGSLDDGPRLSRHISLSLASDIEPAGSPEELLQEHGEVAFEYTHEGDAVAAADVKVEYNDADGAAVSVPLSEFTEEATIEDGDLVRIEPGAGATKTADILTPVTLTAAGDTLAERRGGDRQWLQAGGAPLPLAFTEAGTATWEVAASGGVQVDLSGFSATNEDERCTWPEQQQPRPAPPDGNGTSTPPDYTYQEPTCEPYTSTFALDTLVASLSETVSGTLRATTSLPPEGPRLAFGATATARAEVDIDAAAREDGEPFAGTVDAWAEARVPSSELALQFDAARQLQSITRQGEGIFDADATLTGDFGPTEEMEHPLEHETFGPETEPYDPERAPDELVRFLARAWSLDIAVGDEVAFDMQMPGTSGHSSFVSQVLALETRTVGEDERETYKLSDSFVLSLDPFGTSPQVFSYDYTYWVDAASYLPVHMQGHVERTFNKLELDAYFASVREATGEDFQVHLPDTARLTLRLDSSLDLVGAGTDLATSPVLGAAAVRLVPMASAGLLLGPGITGGGLFSGGDGRSEAIEAMPAPRVGFSFDQDARTVTVVKVYDPLDWADVAVEGCSNLPVEGPVQEGHVISECSDHVTIWHGPTGAVLAEFEFATP